MIEPTEILAAAARAFARGDSLHGCELLAQLEKDELLEAAGRVWPELVDAGDLSTAEQLLTITFNVVATYETYRD